uniref:integrase core domain-containing protein n=1 Tax=Collinsella stercoris TaxID=147206 RepID=UPI0023EFE17D
RSVSRPGNPHDNAVVESTSRILERELAAGGRFGSEEEPRAALFDWANQCNDFRIHSTLSYMGPVEFRGAGLILS